MDNNSRVISFSSPKGGVGRTMTLVNCASIYANGSRWAGIDKTNTILLDFDFHAPGIHHYDYKLILNSCSEDFSFELCSNSKHFKNKKQLNQYLDSNDIGLLFFLIKITTSGEYIDKVNKINEKLNTNTSNKKDIFGDLNKFLFNLLRTKEYSPLQHCIKTGDNNCKIFILPAISTMNDKFSDLVFLFDWNKFINEQFGVNLINATINFFKEFYSFDKTGRHLRILIDQQAGMSIPAAVNRRLSDSTVIVSGLNNQNQLGLEGSIKHFNNVYNDKDPWIVLNQYSLRDIVLDYEYSLNEENTSPYERFKIKDKKKRSDFISKLCLNGKNLASRIFVTDFERNAIQREYLYDQSEQGKKTLTNLIVGIENEYLNKDERVKSNKYHKKIIFIGERVVDVKKSKKNKEIVLTGPFAALYKNLQDFFGEGNVIGIAATHEDIAGLIIKPELKLFIENQKSFRKGTNVRTLKGNMYEASSKLNSTDQIFINIDDLDFISYPYYLTEELIIRDRIKQYSKSTFCKKVNIPDSIGGLTLEYYKELVLGWEKYAKSNDFINGVPLFVNFEFLAYRKEYFSKGDNNLPTKFRKKFNRKFEGFINPQDIIDYSKLSSESSNDLVEDLLLCSSENDMALWYEWQSIISSFYYKNGPLKLNTLKDYIKAINQEDEAFVIAVENYLRLRHLSSTTRNYSQAENKNWLYRNDWDVRLDKFYNGNYGLIYIWPDTIPNSRRTANDFIYQIPPSFQLFEECWMLSAVNTNHLNNTDKIEFLNSFLSKKTQQNHLDYGGLTTHKSVLASLDNWSKYPFVSLMWMVYVSDKTGYRVANRSTFKGYFELGLKMGKIINKLANQIDFDKSETIRKEIKEIINEEIIKFIAHPL